MQEQSLAVVFISNGPGELLTWVKPVAEELHHAIEMRPKASQSSIDLRLVLVPCPNATNTEKSVAQKWNLFENISSANQFWKLIINPKKYGFWPSDGLVVFLGGDQFWSVLLAARLGYKNITYAEWEARWPYWNDKIAAMSLKVRNRIPKKYKNRCTIIGDLMADLPKFADDKDKLPSGKWIAIMPGSKKAKLCVGVPFLLEVADRLKEKLPEYNFLLPIAPTTNMNEILNFSSPKNIISKQYKSKIVNTKILDKSNNLSILTTIQGTKVYLREEFPSHIQLSQCELALTTVGANTAELGALGVPMIVIVPTQHLKVMQAWDGFFGIIARLPGLNWFLGLLLSAWRLRKRGFLSWPNIAAGRLIVPERIGNITPEEIANEAADWLNSPKRLKGQKEDLKLLRGETGAVKSLVQEIINLIT